MKVPLVSIIIPVYNTGGSCIELLKCLYKSTYKNIEIICIDDGSTDDSYKVISDFIKNKKNIILKKQKNAGASAARNAGLSLAHGEWISFIDSDDLVDVTFIEKLVKASTSRTLLACTALLYRRVASGAEHADFMKKIRPRKNNESVKEYVSYLISKDGRIYGAINKLYRKDIIDENKLCFDISLNFAEDTKFVLNYIDAAIKYYPRDCEVKFIYEPLYIYNYGTETSTVSKSSLDWDNWKKSYINLNTWSKESASLRMFWRKKRIWCRWRASHALAVARSKMPRSEKKKYLNRIELSLATLLLKIRK